MCGASYQRELLDAIGGVPAQRVFSHWPVRGGTQWTPQRLTWVAAMMAWDEGQTLDSRWEHAREVAGGLHAHWALGTSYSGFAAALVRESPRIVAGIKTKFREAMLAMGSRHQTRCGWRAFAVDGSRVEAPLTRGERGRLGMCRSRKERAASVCDDPLAHGLGPAVGLPRRTGHRQRTTSFGADARRSAAKLVDRRGCWICGLRAVSAGAECRPIVPLARRRQHPTIDRFGLGT